MGYRSKTLVHQKGISWVIFLKKKASITSRCLLLFSSGLLLTTFFFPLWRIDLWAPQYPEGLSISIWSSKLTGDIKTINILNHYIGMAPIQEESFPELKIFPKIFALLILFGLIASLVGRQFLNQFWTLSLITFAIIAIYDFYRWEHKFGHELNPDAAIKMEDMVYQPPLIGEKMFLNISASSWPSIAGYGFAGAALLAILALAFDLFRKPKT